MSTSFNFPLNPTLNQVVVLPDGNSAQWNGYAWVSVGDNVTYPLAVPKGGTGATNPFTAKRNLDIPIWTLDDAAPAAPVFGDRWIRPGSMTEVVWLPNSNPAGGGVWVNLADVGSVVYPIPVSKGGTGATTPAGARTALGITPVNIGALPIDGSGAMTGVLKAADGTAAAPGLAWASEPGLGWFRAGAATIATTAGGVLTSYVGASDPTATAFSLNPRTPGGSVIYMSTHPGGSPNFNLLAIRQEADGSVSIAGQNIGSATAKPLNLNFSAGVFTTGSLVAGGQLAVVGSTIDISKGTAGGEIGIYGRVNGPAHWRILLGDSQTNFVINRFDNAGTYAGAPIIINRTTGIVQVEGNLVACTSGPSGPTGQLGFAINGDEQSMYLYSSPDYRLWMRRSDGAVHLSTNGAIRSYWTIDGAFTHEAGARKPGGGVWSDSSDARIKENVEDYTRGLDAVLALRPVTYNFTEDTERDTSARYIGLIAQEAEVPMPEMVTTKKQTVGRAAYDDMRVLDTTALTFALINAVKTIDARLKAAGL